MKKDTSYVVAIDLGDRMSDVRIYDVRRGRTHDPRRVKTSAPQLQELFAELDGRARVVMETGTHSPWVSRLAEAAGHEAIVANSHTVSALYKAHRKSDARDRDMLLDVGIAAPHLLDPVRHRSERAQRELALVRMRDLLVRQRTALIAGVRSSLKSLGHRLPGGSPESFHRAAWEAVPLGLLAIYRDVILTIARATRSIHRYDRQVRRLARSHREVEHIAQVTGVGDLTALCFALVIDDPSRFKKSRDVGPYLGLVPRLAQSGGCDPQLPISKAGDHLMRRLLVQAAHHILGPDRPDSDLRRIGLAIAARGGKSGKKRAVVAVARRLAVLLHRLWVTGDVYEPLRNTNAAARAAV